MLHPMEGVFSLSEAARPCFLRSLVQSFGCAYICLWSYDSTSPNRLFFLDGFYNVRNNNQASSSLGSVAHQLFGQYTSLAFDVNDDRVPGLAFRNNRPYVELQQPDLLRLAWTEIQTQFFQEARIKTAVFMGCNKGEIELGFLNMSQVDIQTALRSLFPEDFSRQSQQQIEQNNPPSSSSSSLRSLSTTTGSPEYSSLIFSNIPGATSQPHFPAETLGAAAATMPPVSSTATQAIQEALAAQSNNPSHIFPTPEIENDALMRAILNVISHPSHQQQQNLIPYNISSAFKRYRPDAGPNSIGSSQMGSNFRRQSLLKRSFSFFRSLSFMRMRERIQATRPTSNQLHHMISERRRREKINENFQALRVLLPPGTKKDKASILTTAKETLSSLMAEIDKLSKRNQGLMTSSLVAAKESNKSTEEITNAMIMAPNERFRVQISDVPQSSTSSSSEDRMVDLQVALRGRISQVDALIRLLEFLKQAQNVTLVSMGANTTHVAEGNTLNQLTFRLRILEGSEWDESAFQEAVRRVVGDLVQF